MIAKIKSKIMNSRRHNQPEWIVIENTIEELNKYNIDLF